MQTSQQWIDYFRQNTQKKRVDWSLIPVITDVERKNVLHSLQAWQLGETCEGLSLMAASEKYAAKIGDDFYCEAMQLFIKEEHKHGNNLGRYLDLMGEKRIQKDWGDTLFRKIRRFNTSMECWTITVLSGESAAQIFYQSLKDATNCTLLQQICNDILIDEAAHIKYQLQRLQAIFSGKSILWKIICFQFYRLFYFSIILAVWVMHRRVFIAGKNNLPSYLRKMNLKYKKTIQTLVSSPDNAIDDSNKVDLPLVAENK